RCSLSIPGHQRNHCREISSGAIASHSDTSRVGLDLARMPCDPLCGGIAIFRGRWKRMLWSQAISHRDDQAARMVGQSATHRIMRFNATKNPATAEKIDQRGERPLLSTSRCIDTNGQRTCGTTNETILN